VRSDLSLAEARRIALAAQGFDRPRPSGRINAGHVSRVIRRLGLVQIDYVNVVLPAHYQVLYSRLGPYSRSLLDDLMYKKREFIEEWAHEASILPIEDWPLVRHRMGAGGRRANAWAAFLKKHDAYAREVLDAVHARGSMTVGEAPPSDIGRKRRSDGWGWSITKTMLEGHFMHGRLAVLERRSNAARVYAPAEHVIPREHFTRETTREESERELLRRAARGHGVGTAADLADYYRMSLKEARPRLAEMVDAGDLKQVRIEGWKEPAYLYAEAKLPKSINAHSLLSPFDPVVWFRPRTQRLFDFEYRFEIFVPEAKRRWGTYVLPFLMGDRLVARVDLKAERERKRLEVRAAYLEPHAEAKPVAEALARELTGLAGWLGLDVVKVARRGGFSRALAAALPRSSRS
jgi:uncharacterized protein YcaQ